MFCTERKPNPYEFGANAAPGIQQRPSTHGALLRVGQRIASMLSVCNIVLARYMWEMRVVQEIYRVGHDDNADRV